MAEINPISIEPIKEVQPIENLIDMIQYLLDGKVLRIEQEDQGTVLLRMNPGKHKLTEISRDIDKETYFYKRYWLPYNFSINALVTFTVYLDETYTRLENKFKVDDIVEYELEGTKDVAYITQVLQDQDRNYYYKLSGENDSLFRENEIKLLDKH